MANINYLQFQSQGIHQTSSDLWGHFTDVKDKHICRQSAHTCLTKFTKTLLSTTQYFLFPDAKEICLGTQQVWGKEQGVPSPAGKSCPGAAYRHSPPQYRLLDSAACCCCSAVTLRTAEWGLSDGRQAVKPYYTSPTSIQHGSRRWPCVVVTFLHLCGDPSGICVRGSWQLLGGLMHDPAL